VAWAAELAEMDQEPIPVYPKDNPISVLRKMTQTLLKNINISGAITDNLRYIIH
jgi:protease-4